MASRKPKQQQPEATQPVVDTLGINVEMVEGACHLSFPFSDHLRRIVKERLTGVEFDPQAKAWIVPTDQQANIEALVNDLRAERARMAEDRKIVEEAATKLVTEAKVKDAYKADNTRTSGKILAVGEFFIAQAAGKNYVTIHEAGILRCPTQGDTPDQVRWDKYQPIIGEQKSIVYKKGLGIVQERVLERSNNQERSRQPEAVR
jgi:hypothetical protein